MSKKTKPNQSLSRQNPKSKPNPNKLDRPPVITIMGHIDHGKTTLLDALRNTKIQSTESGGITQHIGAYQINYKNKPLTFIDTPGHSAFTAMRSRGAKATDIVILVIDAQESVKPQTKECITHINLAKVPFLVAINKMDLPNSTPEIVKKDLADAGVSVEGYGGDIVCLPISAKTKQGLDELLDMVLLLAEMQKLTADPNGSLEGLIIESSLDQKRGPLATIIIKNGTLKIGDQIQAGTITGKVKAIFDDLNQPLKQVLPSQPAQILGFNAAPPVGSHVRPIGLKLQALADSDLISINSEPSKEKSDKTLNIILKADVVGTLEAITQNLTNEINLITSGVDNITESDVSLAQSTGANIIAFKVKTTPAAAKLADTEGVLIKTYSLIHELLDDLQEQVLKLLEPTINETSLGTAKIIQEFTVKGQRIAGCEVTSGKLSVGDQVHLIRHKDQIGNSKIISINKDKEKVDKAKNGDQCGVSLSPELDFNPKDTLQAFKAS